MSVVGKSSAVLACMCMLTTVAFAQNKTVIIKYLNPKQDVRKTLQSMTRVPSKYARVNALDEIRRNNFQHAVLDGLEMAFERQAVQAASAQRAVLPSADLNLNLHQRKSWVDQKIKPIKDYLAAHQNNWPEYNKYSESNHLLRYIASFMEVENPTPEILALQREIIRLRATSNAPAPYDVVQIVGAMMEYNIVPARATVSARQKSTTSEEIALGEDLAFAMAAVKVPMKDNPWRKISGFDRIVDITNTYNAMRRQDPLLDGIPEIYLRDEMGIHFSNIPLLTKAQYLKEQHLFAQKHPFEYVLAPFWEHVFGRSFYRIFNRLSEVEKQAILFNAPKLPQAVNIDSNVFSLCYDNAVRLWEEYNHREVSNYAGVERTNNFMRFLKAEDSWKNSFQFRTTAGLVSFGDLSYPQQVEVLMWGWKHLHMLPSQMLKRFEVDSRNYF